MALVRLNYQLSSHLTVSLYICTSLAIIHYYLGRLRRSMGPMPVQIMYTTSSDKVCKILLLYDCLTITDYMQQNKTKFSKKIQVEQFVSWGTYWDRLNKDRQLQILDTKSNFGPFKNYYHTIRNSTHIANYIYICIVYRSYMKNSYIYKLNN